MDIIDRNVGGIIDNGFGAGENLGRAVTVNATAATRREFGGQFGRRVVTVATGALTRPLRPHVTELVTGVAMAVGLGDGDRVDRVGRVAVAGCDPLDDDGAEEDCLG